MARLLLGGIAGVVLVACGAKTPITVDEDAGRPPQPIAEVCNGADDDLDNQVDEDFRDAQGRYVSDAHCGACNVPCVPANASELQVACGVLDGAARCIAQSCAKGFVVGDSGRCVRRDERLCLGCAEDSDCGSVPGAGCQDVGGESRCVVGCGSDSSCPAGYACQGEVCLPQGGSCSCGPSDQFEVACAIDVPGRKPGDPQCLGRAQCADGVLSQCAGSEDICDGVDNDCDGVVDQNFVDARGVYSVDPNNCGQCGVSCDENVGPMLSLRCGGDPFAPTCVVDCPDALDGLQPGDKLDGDFNIANGCECTFTNAKDVAGPNQAEGDALDVNCDGADGVIVESYYVASDGDDSGPGSPTRPLRSLAEAFNRAALSLTTEAPRADIFVAAGTYTESLRVPPGLRVHGGYRRDFRDLDVHAFESEIRASADVPLPGGAVLWFEGGDGETLVEGLTLRGRDAESRGQAALGVVLQNAGSSFSLRDSVIYAGLPGEGNPGRDGNAGAGPSSEAQAGGAPRAAVEDALHSCIDEGQNRVAGGAGGQNTCGGSDTVNGGRGGGTACPDIGLQEGSGKTGQRADGGAQGGAGGAGGQGVQGPITNADPDVCPSPPCCGLADFSVPTNFSGPAPGAAGQNGSAGGAGGGCTDAFGRFDGSDWHAGHATAGADGKSGGGGGGGGAGGGARIDWSDGSCEFVDGLGGGGGGGGGGGCGGKGGSAGGSGAPSVALLVLGAGGAGRPQLSGLTLRPSRGGDGAPGGGGGEGGAGGSGAFGGSLPRADLTTPTLAGPFPGARGGKGGDGGGGGGGGGGCGGASVGLWVAGGGSDPAWSSDNQFDVAEGGAPGAGGGGGSDGKPGRAGEGQDVYVQ